MSIIEAIATSNVLNDSDSNQLSSHAECPISRPTDAEKSRRHVVLPLEILETVINLHAEEGDTETVKAWALTSRALLPSCRSHIFSTIKLLPDPSHPYWTEDTIVHIQLPLLRKFTRVIESNPDLAFYVRTLHFCVRRIDYHNELLARILQRLTHVKKLVLSSRIRTRVDPRLNWRDLSKELQRGLQSIIQSLSLVDLHLSAIFNLPAIILASSKNLRHLSLHYTDFVEVPIYPEVEAPGTLLLTSLTISNLSARGVRDLIKITFGDIPLVDLSRLSTFIVRQSHLQEVTVAAEVLQLSNHMQNFSITVDQGHGSVFFQGMVRPGTLKTLETFKAVIIISWQDSRADPLLGLCNEFDKWGGSNVLERVDVVVHVEEDAFTQTGAVWSRFNTLAVEDRFPALRKVILHIQFEDLRTLAAMDIHKGDEFQALKATERVDFEFTTRVLSSEANFRSKCCCVKPSISLMSSAKAVYPIRISGKGPGPTNAGADLNPGDMTTSA
ncbi:unnamed protein product [Cyclocybe aegerita]|uniref:Uncharacterized protein n=1 Tax=Cyclocybe aegerita TaxID=1973307 RepID=A0A8S0XTA2_CYCAE|nr:unnamed protein product [Cyclocybe aegerita]